jgi:hypothetical protein
VTTNPDADQLARLAVELVVRLRDDNPDANARWLAAQLPDPGDWFRLAFVLAAAVPTDRSWSHLTAWTRMRGGGRHQHRPCGTHAAAERHRLHKEPLCPLCREAERLRDRDRKRVSRRNAASARAVRDLTPDRRSA